MPEILVVEPVFAERVWGGTTLRQWFGDKVPDGVMGECWAVSGLPGMSGVISRGAPAGTDVAAAWRDGLVTGAPRSDAFPLLCKILDPQDWLSVQVHPNDVQAQALAGQPHGKAECWYILSCQPGAELILGHRRQTAAQLRADTEAGRILDELIKQPVRPGSFFMVPAGCVHAVGPGMLVYEVQQSSDLTYRLYDYDRPGLDGRPRELHLDKGFTVVTAPFDPAASLTAGTNEAVPGGRRQVLVGGDYFTVTRWDVDRHLDLTTDDYRILTVIDGQGVLHHAGRDLPARRGLSVIVPRGAGPVRMGGDLSVIVTDPGPLC